MIPQNYCNESNMKTVDSVIVLYIRLMFSSWLWIQFWASQSADSATSEQGGNKLPAVLEQSTLKEKDCWNRERRLERKSIFFLFFYFQSCHSLGFLNILGNRTVWNVLVKYTEHFYYALDRPLYFHVFIHLSPSTQQNWFSWFLPRIYTVSP